MISKEQSILTLVLLSTMAVNTAQGFDIKGVQVGRKMNPTDVGTALGIHCTLLNCQGETTLAGQWANIQVTFETNLTVRSIAARFQADNFDAVRKGLLDKFGRPTSITPRNLQNQIGIAFDDQLLIWQDTEGSQASLVGYLTATSSLLWIKSRAALEEEQGTAKPGNDL